VHDDGFAAVFAARHADLLRLAVLLAGDRTRAEDAVSEAFIKTYRRWARGDIDDPRAYLRRAVVNEVRSRFRRLAIERREAAKRSGDDRGDRSADEQVADADAVLGALAALQQRQRTAVVLRYYGDLSEAQIAETMGVSRGTVKSTISRGIAALRAEMGAGALLG
jgi:RNA polymerase sigma-70 factor (sigma-E family)